MQDVPKIHMAQQQPSARWPCFVPVRKSERERRSRNGKLQCDEHLPGESPGRLHFAASTHSVSEPCMALQMLRLSGVGRATRLRGRLGTRRLVVVSPLPKKMSELSQAQVDR
jgi:hypothetical protein